MRLSQQTGVNDVKMCIPKNFGDVLRLWHLMNAAEDIFTTKAHKEHLIETLPKLNDVRVGEKFS